MEAQFHRSSPKMTICEKLREINDLHQTGSEHDVAVRRLLVEAQVMGKKMSKKLLNYSVDVFKDFWEKNPNYLENLRKRIDCDYLSNGNAGAAEKELKLFASKINSRERHGKYIGDYLVKLPASLKKDGCIVEVGSWLGQTTAFLAMGIKKFDRHDLQLHCFDQWKATEKMCETNKNLGLKPGENLFIHFKKNIAPFQVKTYNHKIKPMKAKWKGQGIDLFVFNSGMSGKEAKKALNVFSPFFVKGETTILWMDYYYYEEDRGEISWKNGLVSKFLFDFTKRIDKSKIAVFKYK